MSKLMIDPDNSKKLIENWFEELADACEVMGLLPDLEITAKHPQDQHTADQMQDILRFLREKGSV